MDDTTNTEQAPVLTVEQFLAKYPTYYKYDRIQDAIEVDCKKRNSYVTDEEIADLKAMNYINVLSRFEPMFKDDYTAMCCGQATFVPVGEVIWLDEQLDKK